MPTISGERKVQFQDLFSIVGTAYVTTNPAAPDAGDYVDVTATVTGAALGDFVMGSLGVNPTNNFAAYFVSAANTVTIRIMANKGATAGTDLAAINAKIVVLRANPGYVSA